MTFRNKLFFFYCEELLPPKLEYYLLLAVRDCLFCIFAATLHTRRPSPPSAIRGRPMPWWQGPTWHGLRILWN